MAVTLKDISELAGVSRQAVSAVLNNSLNSRVSAEKRKKIIEIARKKNYKANLAARQLRGMSTKTIGILTGKDHGALQGELFNQLNRNLLEKGYCNYYIEVGNAEQVRKTVSDLIARGVEGIISSNINFSMSRSECPVPLVLISRPANETDIYIDNSKGGYMAVEHLISHGHKRIAFLTTTISANKDKLIGMKKALSDAGLDYRDSWGLELTHNINSAKEIDNLIENERITAFFASNDFLAGKLLGFLNKRGYNVPEQIAVIGYDGMSFGEFTNPPLTTVIQPVKELAKKAVELMEYKIKNKVFERMPMSLETKLFIGSSCGCRKDNLDMIYWEGTLSTLEELFDYIEPVPENSFKEISKEQS